MSEISCLANCSYSITNRKRFDAIPVYHPTEAELAAPAEPVTLGVLRPAGVYYTLTDGARVAIARVDALDIKWIETPRKVTIYRVTPDERVKELA